MWLRQRRCRQSRHTESSRLRVRIRTRALAGNRRRRGTTAPRLLLNYLLLFLFFFKLRLVTFKPSRLDRYLSPFHPCSFKSEALLEFSRIHACKTSNKKSPFCPGGAWNAAALKAVSLECSIDQKVHGIKSKQQENNPNKGAKYIKYHSKSTQHNPYCTFRLFISNIKGGSE